MPKGQRAVAWPQWAEDKGLSKKSSGYEEEGGGRRYGQGMKGIRQGVRYEGQKGEGKDRWQRKEEKGRRQSTEGKRQITDGSGISAEGKGH